MGLAFMKARYYYSEGSKCGGCGSDLGQHQVWTIVFSDDPAEIVERALSGKINWVKCKVCAFDSGWLWPPIFLYVVTEEERAVCVTLMQAAAQQVNLLRAALDTVHIRERGLDPHRLLPRTKIVNSYGDVAEALKIPIEQVEQENEAILRYLGRSELRGRARLDRLIEDAIDTGALSLEAEEYTAEFLDEVEQYRSMLTGQEDPGVAEVLEELSRYLNTQLVLTRKRLPQRDQMSALAEVIKSTTAPTQKDILKSFFEGYLRDAQVDAVQLRLVRLCGLQAHGLLEPRAAAPIDLRPELTNLVEEMIAGQDVGNSVLSERDLRMLPAVRTFLSSLTPEMLAPGLREADPDQVNDPPPAWLTPAKEVLNEIYTDMQKGIASETILDPIADSPLAKTYVYVEIGEVLTRRRELSGAMNYVSKAKDLIEGWLRNSGETPDYFTSRLHAVCLERMGRVQGQYERFEDWLKAIRAAREIYEQIGARDGELATVRDEAFIWMDLGQFERAEELFERALSASEGNGRRDEVRDLTNLANVYRRMGPWLEAELNFTLHDKKSTEAPSAESPEVRGPKAGELAVDDSFEKKGGMGVAIRFTNHDEMSFREIFGSRPLRLLYRALAVATLNGDADFERRTMGRLVAVYSEQGCTGHASQILDRLLENSTLEAAGLDAQLFAISQLQRRGDAQGNAGELGSAQATRLEELQLREFVLAQGDQLPPLVSDEMLGEKACLLEALDRAEEARLDYRETIQRLERSRLWMRDPENKRGLQSRRWRPYVRAARNSLQMYSREPSRVELLNEAWYYIQAGRSRAMLDMVGAAEPDINDAAGVTSVRPTEFKEVSARLANDVAVLEFVLMPTSPGCPGSWTLFVVEPNADSPWLAWQEPDMERVLEAQKELAAVAGEYEDTIVEYGFGSASPEMEQRYVSALETVADVLLPSGLLEKLRASGYRRLVIVADAYLHEVPFAALRPVQGGERCYLGLPNERSGFQLIYAPSSTIFGHWSRRASASNATVHRATLFVDPLGDLSESNPAVMETFAGIESSLRGRHFEVTRLDGKDATPQTWLNKARESDLLVYFGHSIAGPQDTLHAALVLNDGSGAEAPITTDSIYRAGKSSLFSNRSLFIFASCSGGLVSAGTWDSDRELRGLSAAHLYAGCGSVIAASRPLLDSPTLVLLNMLLTEILGGLDAASSLTQAQLRLASSSHRYAHPHFWGYVSLMGGPDWRFEG
jgi:CHAT domain-containing protein/tetratricopeptide (TPR) repeat protein